MTDPERPPETAVGTRRAARRLAAPLTVRSAMLLTALAALGLWSARRIWENATPRAASVTAQLAALRDGTPVERIEAADLLAQAEASQARRVLVPLLIALGDPDPRLREAAARSLSSLLQEGIPDAQRRPAVSHLIDALDDPVADVRASVAWTLSALARPRTPPASTPPPPPAGVVDRSFRPAIAPLLSLLSDQDPMVRAASLDALTWIVPPEEGAPARLMASVEDPDGLVRRNAIQALGRPWSNQTEVQRILLHAFRQFDPEPTDSEFALRSSNELSSQACYQLEENGQLNEETIAGLIDVVRSGSEMRRRDAIYLLGRAKGRGLAALPPLAAQLERDGPDHFEPSVLDAILEIDPRSPEALRGWEVQLEVYLSHFDRNRTNGWNASYERRFLGANVPVGMVIARLRAEAESEDATHREAATRLMELLAPAADPE